MRWDLIVAAALHFQGPARALTPDQADRVVAYLHQHRTPTALTVAFLDEAARAEGVPVEHVFGVCLNESGAGTSRRPARLCGVMRHAATMGVQAEVAARSLARRYAECRTWDGAYARFNTGGRCAPNAYARDVGRFVGRLVRWRAAEVQLTDAEARWQGAHAGVD